MRQVLVHNVSRPSLDRPVKAIFCSSFLCRLRGLTFRRSLPEGEGLLLVQGDDSRLDASIHMLFVWMDLAVVWINSAGEVVDVRLARRWSLAYAPQRPARFVLEMVPARLDEFGVGDRIQFEDI
jgi:uncharacterized membrane protein (UPF0127 family)